MTRTLLHHAVAVMLLLGAGYAHGHRTGRWAPAPADGAARLARVPPVVGGWEGRPLEVERRSLTRLGIEGHLFRRYEDRRTGASVTVLVVCGRPGPIAVHSPDVCLEGAGYEPAAPPEKVTVPASGSSRPAEFWRATFTGTGGLVPLPAKCVYWSWAADTGWRAPEAPRFTFASAPVLYKLYVILDPSAGDAADGDDPTGGFLTALLGQLQEALSPTRGPHPAPPAPRLKR